MYAKKIKRAPPKLAGSFLSSHINKLLQIINGKIYDIIINIKQNKKHIFSFYNNKKQSVNKDSEAVLSITTNNELFLLEKASSIITPFSGVTSVFSIQIFATDSVNRLATFHFAHSTAVILNTNLYFLLNTLQLQLLQTFQYFQVIMKNLLRAIMYTKTHRE